MIGTPGVDVAFEDGLMPLIAALKGRTISLLVVAAGYQELDTIDTVTREGARRQFEINALGPLFAVKKLRGFLQKGGKVWEMIAAPSANFCNTLCRPAVASCCLL